MDECIKVYQPRGKELRCTNLMEVVQTLWKGIEVYKPRGGCTNPMERK